MIDRVMLSQLVVFATVARQGGFRAAAKTLGIAPSAVSHAVASLEAGLGLRLLARSTRAVRPTDEGAALLARVAGPLSDIAAGLDEARARQAEPSGILRVTMPSIAAEELILPRLPEFFARHPRIALEIAAHDRFEDIAEGGYDAGLRLGESLGRDMIAVRASRPCRALVVAAPDYFARHPPPREPGDLDAHDCIRRRFDSGHLYRWEFQRGDKALAVDVSGRLVAAMTDWCPEFEGFYIYFPSRRQMRPALRAFVDFFRHRDG
ncbi:MAG: LysR substrate-binding domain-containing protein [Paracoccus sp. (in: a-proteobacteria)]|uniref:LysR substrate-binding domain-containing protein n=1 Tax=Paracoccus sp. TaxID=267 RepID=UPI0039E2B3EF